MIKCKITDVAKAVAIINKVDKEKGILMLYPDDKNLLIAYDKDEPLGENDPELHLPPKVTILYRDAIESREMFQDLIYEFKLSQPYGEVKKALVKILERMYV